MSCEELSWAGDRVVTSSRLAYALSASPEWVRATKSRHADQLTKGVHYYVLTGVVLQKYVHEFPVFPHAPKNRPTRCKSLVLWTLEGALAIAYLRRRVETNSAYGRGDLYLIFPSADKNEANKNESCS